MDKHIGDLFNGTPYWLQIGVRTNGIGASFTPMSPRQELTPTPYAIFAEGANAAGLSGTIPMTGLSGTYGGAVNLTNAGNSFTGNGGGLISLNASQLTSGTVPAAALGNAWQIAGNAGTSPTNGNFVGTTDNQALELHVNGIRGWRLEPATNPSIDYSNAVNILGGCSANFAAPGAFGATIAGGGAGYFYGTGSTNSVAGIFATVGGGVGNTASNEYDTVAGGKYNTAGGYFLGAATVSGGELNIANGIGATVGGGVGNSSTNYVTTVSGGQQNIAGGAGSFVGGGGSDGITGQGNIASGRLATVGGGMGNIASGDGSFVGGGGYNGGNVYANTASGVGATVGGGNSNKATKQGATVPGGEYNHAQGADSFAAGYGAQALNDDCFVWSDGELSPFASPFSSTAPNQFLIYAGGGVGIGTNHPQAQLHVTSSGGSSVPQAQLDQQTESDYSRLRFTVGGNASKRWDLGATATNFVIYSGSIGANMIYLDHSGLTVNGAFVSSSDRNVKAGFEPVDTRTVLERVAAMPITRWHYTNDVSTPHLGPMAQDFHAAFNVGMDDKHIATVDEEGVALAAIQGLNQKVEELKDELNRRGAESAELKQRLAALERVIRNQRSN